MNKFDECQKPFTPCWCGVAGRENNPHCKNAASVPIDNPVFIILMIFIGMLVFLKCKPIKLKGL